MLVLSGPSTQRSQRHRARLASPSVFPSFAPHRNALETHKKRHAPTSLRFIDARACTYSVVVVPRKLAVPSLARFSPSHSFS